MGEQLGADSEAQAFESECFRSACGAPSGALLSVACDRMEFMR
jgi:hypothetical protein